MRPAHAHQVLGRDQARESGKHYIIQSIYLYSSLRSEGNKIPTNNAAFWDMMFGFYKNRRFGGTIAFIIRVIRINELEMLAVTTNRSKFKLLVTTNFVPSSLILSTLMTEVTSSSETSVLTRATRSHISENGMLHSYRCGNLKSYDF
jgi:hypothetical protein